MDLDPNEKEKEKEKEVEIEVQAQQERPQHNPARMSKSQNSLMMFVGVTIN